MDSPQVKTASSLGAENDSFMTKFVTKTVFFQLSEPLRRAGPAATVQALERIPDTGQT